MQSNETSETIRRFLGANEVAVVGVSRRKFGGSIYKTLKKRGYQVYPVHPRLSEFEGDRCYANLAALPDSVKVAVIALSPANAATALDHAQGGPVEKLWFQQGPDFSEIVARAEAAGYETVSGKCILMYAEPVGGIHALHRFLARLFGRY